MNQFEHRELLPRLSAKLETLVRPINRFFDWLYHSQYNPLYRSGTLVMGLLVVLLITGLYLIFFYSVSHPYQSVVEIQQQLWLGRWIRSLHRYATDMAIVAVVFHILQLLVQGKTYGPRLLAWVSGVVLLGLFYISAWSGYVMIWDEHAQVLALSGAKMLQTLPFLHDVLEQAFNGTAPVNQSFFFMNLFLHVSLPVGLIFGLLIHTAKISRTKWFPLRPIFVASVVSLTVLSILWPAPLLPEADLLKSIGQLRADVFLLFWVPLARYSPALTFLCWIFGLILLATIPWWWRPSQKRIRGTSIVDEEGCSGCTQCARDCPYEAITMVPRPDGRKLVAKVNAKSCVSCGICAASCDDLAIGPPGRDGREQRKIAEGLLSGGFAQLKPTDTIIIVCGHNGPSHLSWQKYAAATTGVFVHAVDCCGTVHTQMMEMFLKHAGGIFVHACPERNCFNRDGLDLASQRIWFKRVPFLARDIDRRRLAIDASSEAELVSVFENFENFRELLKSISDPKAKILEPETSFYLNLRRVMATVAMVGLLGVGSQVPLGKDDSAGIFRVGTRLPGRSITNCRPPTESEKLAVPKHMQVPEVCEKKSVDFRLTVILNDQEKLVKEFKHGGIRGDTPILVNAEVSVLPGKYKFQVILEPTEPDPEFSTTFELEDEVNIEARRIYLVTSDPTSHALVLRH